VIIPLYYGRACELCGAFADGAEGDENPRRIAWHVSAGRKKWFEGRDYYPLQSDNRALKRTSQRNINKYVENIARRAENHCEVNAGAPTTSDPGGCGTKLVLFNGFSVDKMLAPPASERSAS
jgi:hypothetical protein